jgi:RNA polymerase subunit RPABC4/transcription elongation factor Spt4
MALIACHECRAQISDGARRCPQCGATSKRMNIAGALMLVTLLALVLLWMLQAASF